MINGWFTFLQEFVRHPRQVASVVPSSRFLERRIVEAAGIRSAKVVVELGPGTGGTTRAILRSPAHGVLSRSLAVLEYEGRRSGRTFAIPLRYAETAGGRGLGPPTISG